MKKASKILLLIGAILAIFMVILWGVLSAVYFAAAALLQGVIDGTITVDAETAKRVAELLQNMTIQQAVDYSITIAVIFLVFALLSLAACILGFISKNKENKGLFIADMVLGLLSGCLLNLLGGIFGLVATITKKE